MANVRTVVVSLLLLVLAVLASAPRASADMSELFYVSGTFTNLLGQTETLAPSSSVLVDLTSGTILSADLVVPGATFTGTPTDILNSYTWSYTKSLSLYSLTVDIPPLFVNNLINFNGGSAVGALTLPLPFGISGSDTLELTPSPEPASALLFGTGLLATFGFIRRRSTRQS